MTRPPKKLSPRAWGEVWWLMMQWRDVTIIPIQHTIVLFICFTVSPIYHLHFTMRLNRNLRRFSQPLSIISKSRSKTTSWHPFCVCSSLTFSTHSLHWQADPEWSWVCWVVARTIGRKLRFRWFCLCDQSEPDRQARLFFWDFCSRAAARSVENDARGGGASFHVRRASNLVFYDSNRRLSPDNRVRQGTPKSVFLPNHPLRYAGRVRWICCYTQRSPNASRF